VFLLIILVKTPPSVSIPSDRGVTSKSTIPPISPLRTPAYIAAPIATASSGLTDLFGVRPYKFFTNSCTLGILDIPPTSNTSLISFFCNPESFMHFSHGSLVLLINLSANYSYLALVIFIVKCLGSPLTCAM